MCDSLHKTPSKPDQQGVSEWQCCLLSNARVSVDSPCCKKSALAEYFMYRYKGRRTWAIYNDLSKPAQACREVSALRRSQDSQADQHLPLCTF